MKTLKKITVFFTLIYMMFWGFYSIVGHHKGYCYYGTHDIKVSEAITIRAEEKNIDYCVLLRKSFTDDNIFSEFISLEFYDGSAIDHAAVVQDLYKYYGSDKFWNKAKFLNKEKQQLIEAYLNFNNKLEN